MKFKTYSVCVYVVYLHTVHAGFSIHAQVYGQRKWTSHRISQHTQSKAHSQEALLSNSSGVARACMIRPSFLHEFWQFEFRTSCLSSKCSYLLSHDLKQYLYTSFLFVICVFHPMHLDSIHFQSRCIHPLPFQIPTHLLPVLAKIKYNKI